jgi:hypothetical protein
MKVRIWLASFHRMGLWWGVCLLVSYPALYGFRSLDCLFFHRAGYVN